MQNSDKNFDVSIFEIEMFNIHNPDLMEMALFQKLGKKVLEYFGFSCKKFKKPVRKRRARK